MLKRLVLPGAIERRNAMVWAIELPAPVDQIAVAVGSAVASVIDVFATAIAWIHSDPKSFYRSLALESIMFVMTTMTLGTVFHLVQRGNERRVRTAAERRKELILGPFRRM